MPAFHLLECLLGAGGRHDVGAGGSQDHPHELARVASSSTMRTRNPSRATGRPTASRSSLRRAGSGRTVSA